MIYPNQISLGFVGWWRPSDCRAEWQKICSAGTREDCWKLLRAFHRGRDFFVAPIGRDPNVRRDRVQHRSA